MVPLSGRSFSLTHIYTAGGTYTVTIDIADDDASASATHTVTVAAAGARVRPRGGAAAHRPARRHRQDSARRRDPGKAEVIAAQVLIGRGNNAAAVQVLRAEVAQIDAAGPLPRGQGRRCGPAAQGR